MLGDSGGKVRVVPRVWLDRGGRVGGDGVLGVGGGGELLAQGGGRGRRQGNDGGRAAGDVGELDDTGAADLAAPRRRSRQLQRTHCLRCQRHLSLLLPATHLTIPSFFSMLSSTGSAFLSYWLT